MEVWSPTAESRRGKKEEIKKKNHRTKIEWLALLGGRKRLAALQLIGVDLCRTRRERRSFASTRSSSMISCEIRKLDVLTSVAGMEATAVYNWLPVHCVCTRDSNSSPEKLKTIDGHPELLAAIIYNQAQSEYRHSLTFRVQAILSEQRNPCTDYKSAQ